MSLGYPDPFSFTQCIFQCEDEAGTVGVRLEKELMAVAGEALKVR